MLAVYITISGSVSDTPGVTEKENMSSPVGVQLTLHTVHCYSAGHHMVPMHGASALASACMARI